MVAIRLNKKLNFHLNEDEIKWWVVLNSQHLYFKIKQFYSILLEALTISSTTLSSLDRPWPCPTQNKKLDWFPRMRAMSLCSDEAENDQNEFRDLKVTLESTKNHVESLSKQLQELKDQVILRTYFRKDTDY